MLAAPCDSCSNRSTMNTVGTILEAHLKLRESGLDPVLLVLGDIQDCELIPSLNLRLGLKKKNYSNGRWSGHLQIQLYLV